ncbi:MAG: TetR/AcrR family transcriptional regulator [Hyphomicrobiaceae bacterium]|nr:TetR/AcrR family transcriptional regulator [Hyphomicrobiaceae bacterium]MCC0023800.1 TetR/AcrR family transcriptional regulator [Hyphomicrobiaceae bacterium]
MPRITKAPEERRLEIIETSERLFRQFGFTNVSVDQIIREIGVAKGTFYYYFKSKEEILGAIVDRALDQMVDQVKSVAREPSLSALAKMELLLRGSQVGDDSNLELAEMMHLPGNRELHELSNIQTVLRLSPLFAEIVEQGNGEGTFACERPLETVQFLLTGAHFLLDGGLFAFSPEEQKARRITAQRIIELGFGAAPGSFDFMNPKQGKD